MKKKRDENEYGTGYDDGLEALQPLDIGAATSVDDMVRAMSNTAFGGRRIGEAADALEAMVRDEDCFRVVTISGAMTIAKQGLILCEMIDRGWVQAIVTTGALMTHGLVEGAGMQHFKHRASMSDEDLFTRGYNRVYDTIELESNLNDSEVILRAALANLSDDTVLCSRSILHELGRHLSEHSQGRAILKSSFAADIPVYVPAFTDSELGLDFAIYNRRRAMHREPAVAFNPFLDLDDYAERIAAHETIGIFTIGGGVPRNWAQQVGPYHDIQRSRLGTNNPVRRFKYAVRICPEPDHWGGLSGCSYTEGVSWGKFVPEAEGGRFAEVFCDATIGWPLVVKSVMERLGR